MKQRVGHHHASDVNAVKQVFMKWDTKSFIEYLFFYFVQMNIIFLKDWAINIWSEPLVKVRYFVRESWFSIYKKKTDSQLIQNHAALVYMSYITAYNSLKNMFNFITLYLIS